MVSYYLLGFFLMTLWKCHWAFISAPIMLLQILLFKFEFIPREDLPFIIHAIAGIVAARDIGDIFSYQYTLRKKVILTIVCLCCPLVSELLYFVLVGFLFTTVSECVVVGLFCGLVYLVEVLLGLPAFRSFEVLAAFTFILLVVRRYAKNSTRE